MVISPDFGQTRGNRMRISDDKDKRLMLAARRIKELCESVNTLDRLRGGNGRKVRLDDFLDGVIERDQ
jgi:hypothetical protein